MDAIIFDVDGTLWDSTDAVARSWSKTIKEETGTDPHFNGSSISYLFGKVMSEIRDAIFPEYPMEKRQILAEKLFENENDHLREDPGTLYEGVEETFRELSARIPLYIVSNCQTGYIDVLLDVCNLREYITDYMCFGDTNQPKDRTIRILMEKNQIQDAVYVGDTQGDYNSCKLADVPFIYADYGLGDVPDAPVTIHSIKDLLKMY